LTVEEALNTVLFAYVMLSPFTIILWLVILAGGLVAIAVHFLMAQNSGSVSLADLPAASLPTGPSSRWMEIFRESTAGIDIELILYGVLTLIGVLLILRAIVSAIIVIRQRRYARMPETGSPHRVEAGMARHWSILGRGLTGKMLLALTGTVALFGFSTVAVVYFTVTNSLREHQLKRATVLALNISDAAASYVVAKKTAELGALLGKSASGPAMAYIVVADRKGAVAAQSLATLPSELPPSLNQEPTRRTQRQTLTVGGRAVYETTVPLLEGQAGTVRVGLWAQEVEAEIHRTVAPVILGILAVLAGGLICSIYLVWQINRPIAKLVRIASHISHGELDMPLSGTRDPGEFGELSRALERMRSSVKAAMTRLN
jgi:HAMP domain-containing protein